MVNMILTRWRASFLYFFLYIACCRVFWRMLCCLISFNLQKQVTYFTNLGLFIIHLGYNAHFWSSYFCELLIWFDICNFLKLLYFVALAYVKLFNCALFYFLSQIRKWKLNSCEVKFTISYWIEQRFEPYSTYHKL